MMAAQEQVRQRPGQVDRHGGRRSAETGFFATIFDEQRVSMNIRQSGRRRGRNNGGNNRPQGGGGNRGGHDSGNRIDSRTRGNAAQMIEKYKNLARDAQLSGDRVQTEYYLQFADHYFRVLMDFRARQEEGRPQGQGQDRWQSRIEGVENFDGRDDMDPMDSDGSQGDDGTAGEEDGDDRAPRRDGRDNRYDGRDSRFEGRNDREDRGGRGPRPDRGPRGERGDRAPRDDRDQRDFRRERTPREERGEREEGDSAPAPARAPKAAANEDAAVPRGRGRRPRQPAADQGEAVIDSAVLPPAIARPAATAAEGDEGEAAAPKVRRPRRTLAPRDTGAEAAE
jgi:hypothetical protein